MTIKGTWIEKPHKMAGTALCCTACGWKNLLETRHCPNCGAEMETEDGLVVVFELNDDGTYTRKLHTLPDEVSEKADDEDKLKFVAHNIDKLEEKIQQLEKDVDRLEKSRTIEIKPPVYPNITSTGISAYAGPEFNGFCSGLSTTTWSDNNDQRNQKFNIDDNSERTVEVNNSASIVTSYRPPYVEPGERHESSHGQYDGWIDSVNIDGKLYAIKAAIVEYHALTCPKCGGQIQMHNGMGQCQFCGTEFSATIRLVEV